MREVVVVGGGLTGLVAAYELEKRRIPYTLIEVKKRLGGSIHSVTADGVTTDGAAMAVHPELREAALLQQLNLTAALCSVATIRAGFSPEPLPLLAFQQGTEALIHALAAKITAARLMRMAVSSIGELEDGRAMLCLENGVVLDARAIILAVPARFAERMFYGYLDPISEQLRGYRYDTLARVSWVLPLDVALDTLHNAPEIAFWHTTKHRLRVPDGQQLVQIGLRYQPHPASERLASPIPNESVLLRQIDDLRARIHLPEPLMQRVHVWTEADPLTCYQPTHAATISALRRQLPPHVALIGSDYTLHPALIGTPNLADCIAQACAAVQQMAQFLRG